MTASQLKKKKLNPGPKRGIVGDYWLYDIAEATSWSDEQLVKWKQARQRKCLHCGRMVDAGNWNQGYDACRKCLPAAKERHERETRERQAASCIPASLEYFKESLGADDVDLGLEGWVGDEWLGAWPNPTPSTEYPPSKSPRPPNRQAIPAKG